MTVQYSFIATNIVSGQYSTTGILRQRQLKKEELRGIISVAFHFSRVTRLPHMFIKLFVNLHASLCQQFVALFAHSLSYKLQYSFIYYEQDEIYKSSFYHHGICTYIYYIIHR